MRKSILLFITIIFLSCNNDIENLEIKGTVKDAITETPLEGIEVTIICWKYGNSPDESYSEDETVTVTTNNKGIYEYTFDKGALLSTRCFYKKQSHIRELIKNESVMDISLKLNILK